MRRDFYVYVKFRPWNCVPCYVGKGHGKRAFSHEAKSHNPHLERIIRKAGGELPTVFPREGLTEAEAFETEVALIKAIGRKKNGGPLVNMTDGGEGVSGFVPSPEQIAKQISCHTGRKRSAETRARMSIAQRGRTYSPEAIEKMRMSHLGSRRGLEAIVKTSIANRGQRRTVEQRTRMSVAARQRKTSVEGRARIRKGQREGKIRRSVNRLWAEALV